MTEEWRPVVGWEGLYEVSDYGNVRSCDREIEVLNPWGVLAKRRYKGRILRPGINKISGYPLVNFTHPDRDRCSYHVHDLVLAAFEGTKPQGLEICHRDGVRTNNRRDNLRYGTRSSNALDRHEHGTMNQARGTDHFYAKLTTELVRWIRKNSGRLSHRDMAAILNVTHAVVGRAARGQSWKHVD